MKATIAYIECEECGHICMSFDTERAQEKADFHEDENPEHQLYMHVFESDMSHKL